MKWGEFMGGFDKLRFQKSIKYKLLRNFLLIVIVPALIVGISSYIVSLYLIRDKVSVSFSQTVSYVKNDVERNLSQIEQVTGYLFANSDVRAAAADEGKSSYEKAKDNEKLYEVFDNFSISNAFRSIKTIRIYNLDGLVFSYSLDPTYSASYDDQKIMASSYFQQALQNKGETVWANLQNSYEFNPSGNQDSISIFRVIKGENFAKPVGVMYLCVKQDYFSHSSGNLDSFQAGEIYIADSRGDLLNNSMGITEIGEVLNTSGSVTIQDRIMPASWTIVGKLKNEELLRDTSSLFLSAAIAMLFSFLFSCIIWYFLSKSILRPIEKLTFSCQQIVNSGDLSSKVPVESEDEIGTLSANFNYMIGRINSLIQEKLLRQNQIRDAEYKALQAQITPHFLYNALNSIKWMAVIQNEPNIANASETLGRLLKNTTAKTESVITVEREIGNVLDYVFLQRLAYSDKFNLFFRVDSELLHLPCLKFILQPIVENAIFHGIQPKQSTGTILVEICGSRETLLFVVTDDGVGIPPDKVGEILEPYRTDQASLSNRIGINNVNQRIKNIYGERYGLTIESEYGVYTRVTAIIPIQGVPGKEERV